MNPEHCEEFRKGFKFEPKPNIPDGPLDEAYKSVGKVEPGSPLRFSSHPIKFKVDMSKCKWR